MSTTRTRKEISRDISRFLTAKARLESELAQLTTEEEKTLQELGGSLLAGGKGNAGKLAELHAMVETTTRALNLAKDGIQVAREELADLELAERAARWVAIEDDLRQRLAVIREKTGENGLAGELREMYRVMKEGEALVSSYSQEAQIFANEIRNLYIKGVTDLYDLWRMIDHFYHPNAPIPAQNADGTVVGFGSLPDRFNP
jgi:hypothetical protein